MKFILTVFALVIFLLQSCCWYNSGDCFCTPPSPELSEEAIEWTTSYLDVDLLVYENDSGNMDTLIIERTRDKEWFGGDECGIDGDVERATIKSIAGEVVAIIEAKSQNDIAINSFEGNDRFIPTIFHTSGDLAVFHPDASGLIINDFMWNGTTTTVISVACDDNTMCENLEMTGYVVSKNLGLLSFIDADGTTWNRLN